MTYVISTTSLLYANIERVGQVLGQYAIKVGDLQVWNIWKDGSRHRDDPLQRTIADTARIATTSFTIAPAAIPLIGLLPVIPLPALVLALIADIKALHQTNKYHWDPRTVACEVHLAFGNVSPARRAWAEYLLGAFCQISDWQLYKPSASALSGARYAARTGKLPRAWSEQKQTKASRVGAWLGKH